MIKLISKRVIQALSKVTIFKDFYFVLAVIISYLFGRMNHSAVNKI